VATLWLSKEGAVNSICQNISQLHQLFKKLEGLTLGQDKLDHLEELMQDHVFLLLVHCMADILGRVVVMNKTLQSSHVTYYDMREGVDSMLGYLNDMWITPAKEKREVFGAGHTQFLLERMKESTDEGRYEFYC
jgi:hypothetical protein